MAAALEWHARSDGNHWPLAERLRASLASELFDARIARVDDLNGLPGRAAVLKHRDTALRHRFP